MYFYFFNFPFVKILVYEGKFSNLDAAIRAHSKYVIDDLKDNLLK